MKIKTAKVLKSNPAIRAIVRATFPQFAGVKVYVRVYDGGAGESVRTAYTSGWDEGSRATSKIYNTRTGGHVSVHEGHGSLGLNKICASAQVTDNHLVVVTHDVVRGDQADRGSVTIQITADLADGALDVLVDVALRGENPAGLLAEMTPGLEWGFPADKGGGRATVRDLLLAAIEGLANEARKAEKRAAKQLEREEAEARATDQFMNRTVYA